MAMSKSPLNAGSRGGILECPICLSSMMDHRPRALHCLHTFCEPCLSECERKCGKGSITCPTCRQVTPLSQEGVSALPHNFQLDQISSIIRQEKHCQSCIETKQTPPVATFFCGNCQKKYCDSCKDKHETIPVFSDHHIFPILENKPSDDTEKCALHAMTLDLYCLKCQECLCSSCAMNQKHSGHYDRLVNMMKEIDTCNQEASEVINPLKQQMLAWSDSLNETLTQSNKLSISIREEGNKRIQRINNIVDRLQEELYTKHIQPVKECITCLGGLQKNVEATGNVIKRTKIRPDTIAELKRHISECKENKQSLENKIKELHQVPEFVVSPEMSSLGSFSSKGSPRGLSTSSGKWDAGSTTIGSTGTKLQTYKGRKSSEAVAASLMKPGTRVKIGYDWNRDWQPPGEGTVQGRSSGDCVWVRWDNGRKSLCRVGEHGNYDIQLA